MRDISVARGVLIEAYTKAQQHAEAKAPAEAVS
jgi:hypothetical protein